MISEADVLAALPPPSCSSFIRQYVEYAALQTTSPLGYHLGTALTVLSATCPLDYGTNYAGQLRANLYTLLVGRSGEDQKSSALGIGREMLYEASNGALIGDFPGSTEGLLESLARANVQMIPMSEFGAFLAKAEKGYFTPVKTQMADLWDCNPVQRARANGANTRIQNPRLSVLAACSIPYLERHTLAEDWSGGFMGRFLCLYARRERSNPNPIGDRRNFPFLVRQLEERAITTNSGYCVSMTQQALELWTAWYYDLESRKLPSIVSGVKSRAPTIARKAALLYGWDYGPARFQRDWVMDIDTLVPAIKLAELHIKSLVGLSDKIAEHPDARLRRNVIMALETCGGRATLGQILGILKLRKRPVVESLDSLLEEGRVARPQGYTNGTFYVLRGLSVAGR